MTWISKNHHTIELAPTVEQALTQIGAQANDLQAMGVALGPPLEVLGGASPGEPRVLARAAVMEEMASIRTPIEAGRQTVSASVTVLFRILEEAR